MNRLEFEKIEPNNAANACVIWLHGLGANGFDFVPIVPELRFPAEHAVRFIFPHAPAIPVTINGGMVMPAWYDILSLDIDRKIDSEQIQASSDAVRQLIDDQIAAGLDSRNILIAGFSQGGAVAYQTALTYPKPLAGLMCLSTYFATHDSIELHDANRSCPVHVSHGVQDPVVPEILGQQACLHLESMGFAPEYHSYPMQHAVCPDQIVELSRWMQTVLPMQVTS